MILSQNIYTFDFSLSYVCGISFKKWALAFKRGVGLDEMDTFSGFADRVEYQFGDCVGEWVRGHVEESGSGFGVL